MCGQGDFRQETVTLHPQCAGFINRVRIALHTFRDLIGQPHANHRKDGKQHHKTGDLGKNRCVFQHALMLL